MSRGRDAYRAIYLAAPLKFRTTLHAFSRVLPRFHIEEWQKDPHAWQKHKWQRRQEQKRGRFVYTDGPLTGVRLDGWPDPGLLGVAGLVQHATRAQSESLQEASWWQQLAERTYKLRDVMSASDLAVVLDALVSANHRHTLLMKTLTRELIDDVDKLSLMELAVITNAYAHFNCLSQSMMLAFAQHVARLFTMEGSPYHSDIPSDPKSLSVLVKSFALLDYRNNDMMLAINGVVVEHISHLPFAVISEVLTSFVKLRQPFQGDDNFWVVVVSKVPGSRMASLCPALHAVAQLKISQAPLREALASEITRGLSDAPVHSVPTPLGKAFGLWASHEETSPPQRLPSFASGRVPSQLMASLAPAEPPPVARPVADSFVSSADGGAVVEWAEEAALVEDEDDAESRVVRASPRLPRFYNPVSRRLSDRNVTRPHYREFNPSDNFSRNRRGVLVAEALEGLNIFWRDTPEADNGRARREGDSESQQTSAEAVDANDAAIEPGVALEPQSRFPPIEAQLVEVAAPVLRSAIQGLTSSQLASCAQLYALHVSSDAHSDESLVLARDIVQESVRKLANFSIADLRQVHAASTSLGIHDPYLDRARYRRFPKALRTELWKKTSATTAAQGFAT